MDCLITKPANTDINYNRYVPTREVREIDPTVRKPVLNKIKHREFNGTYIPETNYTFPRQEDLSQNQDSIPTVIGNLGTNDPKVPGLGGVSNYNPPSQYVADYCPDQLYLPREAREDNAGFGKYVVNPNYLAVTRKEDLPTIDYFPENDNRLNLPGLIDGVFEPRTYNLVPRTVKSIWKYAGKYFDRGYFSKELISNDHNPYSIIDIYIEELIYLKNTKKTIINELLRVINTMKLAAASKSDVGDVDDIASLERAYRRMIEQIDHRIVRLETVPQRMDFDYTNIDNDNWMGGILDERYPVPVPYPNASVKSNKLEKTEEQNTDNSTIITILAVLILGWLLLKRQTKLKPPWQ